MPDLIFNLQDLRRILQESAGTEEGIDLDGEILDIAFDDLGYDSLALMETAARITREYGIPIDDDALTTATTPRGLLDLVNAG
jgi:act minimal PKS acyl carrier protein